MRYARSLLVALLLAPGSAMAQATDTDIYIAPLRMQDGWIAVGSPVNVTNRAGYDNQPHFTRDGRAILFTAQHDGQTDIYRYDLRTRATTRLTQTPESEYSATPAMNGFSVVRVEADSTQRLWLFDDRGGNPRLLLPNVKPVGYHAWLNDSQLALFVLGSPPTLQLTRLRVDSTSVIASNIGRAIVKVPRWAGVSFVQRDADSTMWIRRVDATREVKPVAKLMPGGEFHAWTPRGELVATSGSTLMQWTPIDGGSWRRITEVQGVTLSRVAISPRGDWIAFVGERAR